MGTPEQDLQALAEEVAELRRQMRLDREAFDALYARILDMRKRCDALASDIAAALQRAAAQRVPAAAPEPEARPLELTPELVRPIPAQAEEEEAAPREAPAATPVVTKEVSVADAVPSEPTSPPAFEPVGRKPAPPATDLETLIGSYWFSRLGAISLLVGFVILAGYIQPYLTPAIRVALSYATAIVLCAIGAWAETAYPRFARPVLSAGLILAFFASFAGYFVPPMHCFSQALSATLMLTTAAIVVAVAGALRSQPLAVLAVAMGFWVAVFATEIVGAFTPAMLLFLSVIGVALFIMFRWATLAVLTVLGVYACDVWWTLAGAGGWEAKSSFRIELAFLTSYFVVFLAGDWFDRLRGVRETPQPVWEKVLPAEQCILAARFANPLAYFLVGTLVFAHTGVFWNRLHYFYWPLGVVLAAVGIATRRIERKSTREEDIFYILSTGVITLGFANAYSETTLSSILAFEGLCLFAMRRAIGRRVFGFLSAALYGLAFLHFNLGSFHRLTPALVSDWRSFAAGLPTVLFTLAPTFLTPFFVPASQDRATNHPQASGAWPQVLPELGDTISGHVRTFAGSLLLLHLFFETVEPGLAFAVWVVLALAALAAAWALTTSPALWTLGGSFLAWAHLYFFAQLGKVEQGDPIWMFPSAIAMTLLAFGCGGPIGMFGKTKSDSEAMPTDWMKENAPTLAAILIAICVTDVTILIERRAALAVRYPLAALLAVALGVLTVYARSAFFGLVGLFLIVVNTGILLSHLPEDIAHQPGFFGWTLGGAALAVVFERRFHTWGESRFREEREWRHYGSMAVIALAVVVLLGLVHFTPWIGKRYETVGITSVAVASLGLGIGLRSALYRRFGLGVFILALARVYLVDLAGLETLYRIIAFIVLSSVLLAVSYFYTRFKDRFQSWV